MNPRRVSDNFAYTPRGSMRDQITLLAANPGRAADGSPLSPYVFAENVWAYIRPLHSQELNVNELVQSEAFYQVVIPYLPGVLSSMTVVSPTGRMWFIVNVVDPDQRGVEWRLLCREINDGGATGFVPAPTPPPYVPEPDVDGGIF
jgi:SPP1 family predicted phage head-tail adaptor